MSEPNKANTKRKTPNEEDKPRTTRLLADTSRSTLVYRDDKGIEHSMREDETQIEFFKRIGLYVSGDEDKSNP